MRSAAPTQGKGAPPPHKALAYLAIAMQMAVAHDHDLPVLPTLRDWLVAASQARESTSWVQWRGEAINAVDLRALMDAKIRSQDRFGKWLRRDFPAGVTVSAEERVARKRRRCVPRARAVHPCRAKHAAPSTPPWPSQVAGRDQREHGQPWRGGR